jgi:hypothetical protein
VRVGRNVARVTLPLAREQEEALRYLMELAPGSLRLRGDKLFRAGAVTELTRPADSRQRFTGMVIVEGDVHQPWLQLARKAQAGCTCRTEHTCEHVYALGRAVLAENSVASVQHLSASAPSAGETPEQVHVALRAAVRRELDLEEKLYCQRVALAFRRAGRHGLAPIDLEFFGLAKDGAYARAPRRPWADLPPDEITFWNYVAVMMDEVGAKVPDFMRPVTDLERVRRHLTEVERRANVERWKQMLSSARVRAGEASSAARLLELRLRLRQDAAVLEWRPPGQPAFAALKQMQMQQMQYELGEGTASLSPEGEWLWAAFETQMLFFGRPEWPYFQKETGRLLARLFRLPELRGAIVNPDGQPFRFVAEPLRWQLDAPDNPDGEYQLQLVRPDGEPLPPMLTVLDGRPSLFIGQQEVFLGPATNALLLDVVRANRIPAAALETRSGAGLLLNLGVELPAALRERVVVQPLRLRLTCRLQSTPGSQSELCSIMPEAIDDRGRVCLSWTGEGWATENASDAEENGSIVVPEHRALHDPRVLLGPLGAKWGGYIGEFTVRVTKKFPELFAPWIRSLPPEVKLDLQGDLASLASEDVVGSVRLEATEAGIDWFDLRVVVDVSDTTLTPQELKLLLNARGNYVRLGDKGWRRLQFNFTPEEDDRLARLGLTPRELSAEPQRLHALQLADEAAKKFLPEAQFEAVQRRALEIQARVTPDVPPNVKAELRPYQRDGFHFLAYLAANRFGGVLADDMGLGKTLQTLTWLAWLRSDSAAQTTPASRKGKAARPGPMPSLVVCPKSVMDNWRAEAERFTPELRVRVWHSHELSEMVEGLAEADLHVMNYNQLRMIGDAAPKVRWLAVVLDEGQYIKNPSSVTAMIARKLQAEHRLVLSGTPIENQLLDLWSLMSFAMPGALGSRQQFLRLYDAKSDPLARRRLSARVRPFLLRRTKTQVAKDLPERIEEDLFCEMEGEQESLYRAELKRAQQMLLSVTTQKQLALDRFHILTSLLRLRQICCHPRLVKSGSKAASAKVEALIEQLEPLMEEGQKVLVFSQFVEMLNILRSEVEERGWKTFYLSGETENRGDLVRDFQSAEAAGVFLISLKAGGFGLNLTAASYVVLFDPWWNPAVENQAIDRTHRIGQQRNVIAYRLLIKNSIEEKIRRLQKQKSALADDVLGEEKFGQALTLDDLKFLFSD